MTTKYFGEFLVGKNVIDAESLIKALISQVATMPPVCEIVYKKHLLSPEEILAAFKYQQDHFVDFISACKAKGFWSTDLQEILNEEMRKYRKPLGEILVKEGFIDLKKLTLMLDEFLSQAEVTAAPSSKVELEETTASRPDENLNPEDDFLDYQSGILMELEEVFDERKRKVIKVAMSFIKDKTPPDEGAVQKLFNDSLKIVHTINGLLKLFGIQHLGQLMFYIENLVEEHLNSKSTAEEHQKIAGLIYDSFELAWQMRNSILETNSERSFFKHKDNEENFYKMINGLMGSIGSK
ncbi:MAG: hypothetical protein AB7I27_07095 [Bacteriovoracaceae bacterium]